MTDKDNHEVKVMPAGLDDLDGIMEVEKEAWGEVGEDAEASKELMRSRIEICNKRPPFWFWVVKNSGRVEGHLIIQPTNLPPEECTSWDQATDGGTLRNTFDPFGEYVYGVAIAMRNSTHPLSVLLLVLAGHSVRIASNKEILYLCARMPGFSLAHQTSGITEDFYWQLKHGSGAPKDPLLRRFYDLIGVSPERLLRNGYPPDEESGGHGVLCVSRDPVGDVVRTARKLSRIQKGETDGSES